VEAVVMSVPIKELKEPFQVLKIITIAQKVLKIIYNIRNLFTRL